MSTRKKKVRPGKIELTEDGRALEVHYESIDIALLPNGQEVVHATKQGTKRIKFELPADGNLQRLAQQIVEGCKLLHAARVPEVEGLLAQAAEQRQHPQPQQQQQQQQPGDSTEAALEEPQRFSEVDRQLLRQQQQQYLQAAAASATQALAAAATTARLDRIDEYLEMLYEEDLGVKASAAAAVAQLFRDPRNLGELQAHPTLLQALARLLREDARKSGELCVSLLMVFFALSHLPQAHPVLAQSQVGSLTMELLDLELRRAEHFQQREGVAVADVGAKLLAGDPLAPAEQRLAVALARQEPLLYAGLSLLLNMAAEDVVVEQKMVKKGLLSLLVVVLDRGSPQLLLLASTFLRKLSLYAENSRRLREAEVVGQLAALVPADGGPLVTSVLRLLHNLSFDEGMRHQMVAAGLIAKATALLKLEPLGAGNIGEGSSRRRPGTAAAAAATSAVQAKGAGGREEPTLQQLALRLLYHLSLQDKHRSMFLYTDAISTVHGMLMAAPSPLAASAPELAALAVSLAGSVRVAEEMARGGRLDQLLARVLGHADGQPAGQDEGQSPIPEAAAAGDHAPAVAGDAGGSDLLLWKLLRALAEHESEPLRVRFAPALHRMVQLLVGCSHDLPPAVFVETLGCLACLDIPGHDYAHLLRETQLHSFLAELAAGGTDDDVLLEVVHAAGVLCADEACAGMLASAGLVDALHALMLERMEDDAFVLATTAAAARMLSQPPTRAALLAHAEVAARFAELLQHPSREVARAADTALDAVATGSEEWACSVRRLKFEAHNQEWLQILRSEQHATSSGIADAEAVHGGYFAQHAEPIDQEGMQHEEDQLHLVGFHGQQGGSSAQQIGAFWGASSAGVGQAMPVAMA